MKLTQTLQPPHLVADGKLLEADDAFLALRPVRAYAVFFAGVVDDHACAAAGAVLLLLRGGGSGSGSGSGVRGLGRVGSVGSGRGYGSGRDDADLKVWDAAVGGLAVAVAGTGVRWGGGRGDSDGGGWVRGARGGGGEVRFDARGDVLFAGRFAAVVSFGWESGVADWAFVFFAEDGDWDWRWVGGGMGGWERGVDV